MQNLFHKKQFKIFLKFLRFLYPYRIKEITILVLSGLSVLLSMVNPYLSKLVVDKAIMNKELKSFITLALIGTGVFIFNGLIKAAADFLEKGIRLKVGFDLNKKIFSHLQGLPLQFFKDRSSGEHLFKVTYDIEKAVDLVVSVPDQFVNIFPKLFFVLAIIFYFDWQMAIFALILAPILYLPVFYLNQRMRLVWEDLIQNSQNIFKRLTEVFSHMYFIKASGRERPEIRGYLKTVIANIKINLRSTRLEVISNFAGGSFERIIIGLITLFGGYQVIRGRFSIGTLTAIMLYMAQLVALQGNIVFFWRRLFFGIISCQRLDEILREKQIILQGTERKGGSLKGFDIQFKGINFGYNRQKYILKDLEFKIEEGWTALAGHSGGGKTTIVNLLLGLYEPWSGQIFIGGQNIKELAPFLFQKEIAVALQEPYLWDDSIENNIKYAKPNATKDEVIEACKLAGVDEFAQGLAEGYGSIIGEDACKLSEGQKQKIAIARALLKKPKILILDEAMSSMDSISEERIITNIKKLSCIHSVILISHRLSAVLACEKVCFLKGLGRVNTDSPQELLHNEPAFNDLFSGQIKELQHQDEIIAGKSD